MTQKASNNRGTPSTDAAFEGKKEEQKKNKASNYGSADTAGLDFVDSMIAENTI